MPRPLAQSLEGLSFPCDRSRLIEYARRNNAGSKALDLLDAIPAREYASLTEVLSAVPSKSEARHRMPQAEPEAVEGRPEPVPDTARAGERESSPADPWSRLTRTWLRAWFPWLR